MNFCRPVQRTIETSESHRSTEHGPEGVGGCEERVKCPKSVSLRQIADFADQCLVDGQAVSLLQSRSNSRRYRLRAPRAISPERSLLARSSAPPRRRSDWWR